MISLPDIHVQLIETAEQKLLYYISYIMNKKTVLRSIASKIEFSSFREDIFKSLLFKLEAFSLFFTSQKFIYF